MFADKMPLDEMSVNEMVEDEMSLDKITLIKVFFPFQREVSVHIFDTSGNPMFQDIRSQC